MLLYCLLYDFVTKNIQVETVQLNPDVECKIESQFKALQSPDSLQKLTFLESIRQGYLVGNSVPRLLCHKKIMEDITILKLQLASSQTTQSLWEERTSAFDKLGTIG